MKAKELRTMNNGELKRFLTEQQAKAGSIRFDITSKQVKNHQELRNTKRAIARAMTVLHEGTEKK